jgi:hypothetical protein
VATYKVLSGEPTWPVGDSLRLVREAGGLRHVAPADRARLRFRTCAAGDVVTDVPAESIETLIAQGVIVEVATASRRPRKGLK